VERKVGRGKKKYKHPYKVVANYAHNMGECISMTNCINIMVPVDLPKCTGSFVFYFVPNMYNVKNFILYSITSGPLCTDMGTDS
jgi:hypothetical protein